MKKNTIIRLVAFLMLAAMMLSAVACANTGTSDETTAGNSGNGAQTEAPVDETTTDPTVDVNGYKKDDLPEDLKFNENINILVWDDVEHEEFEVAYEDLSGDIVEQSLYDRNSKVEERLGLTLNFIRVNGNADNVSGFSAYVNNSVSINAKEFDVIEFLMRNPNRVYSREALLDTIWTYEYRSDIRTVDVHIRRLREKLEENPAKPNYIMTKWGVGYYFKK